MASYKRNAHDHQGRAHFLLWVSFRCLGIGRAYRPNDNRAFRRSSILLQLIVMLTFALDLWVRGMLLPLRTIPNIISTSSANSQNAIEGNLSEILHSSSATEREINVMPAILTVSVSSSTMSYSFLAFALDNTSLPHKSLRLIVFIIQTLLFPVDAKLLRNSIATKPLHNKCLSGARKCIGCRPESVSIHTRKSA